MKANAILGLAVLCAVAFTVIVWNRLSAGWEAQRRAEAKKPWVVREIEKGSKRYWRIPDYPETVTLRFMPWQLARFQEVTEDGKKIEWRKDPYLQTVINYTVEAVDRDGKPTGRPVWDGPFRPGDAKMVFDMSKPLSLRASRVSGPPVYLDLDLSFVQTSFGFPFGPLGNKLVQ